MVSSGQRSYPRRLMSNMRKHYELYLLVLPALIFFIVFHYLPMYGVQIAFRDYYPGWSMAESPWVGLDNFRRFFRSYQGVNVIVNTLRISVMGLVLGFPGPILLALMLNNVGNLRFKRMVQSVTYAPYFISAVAMAGMILVFLSTNGLINGILALTGADRVQFMGKANLFPWIYTIANVWKNLGWNSIIYIAALAAVDSELYEAARIDGASRLRIVRHIDLPSIAPTIMVLLILNAGRLMSVGHEQILLLQNSLNRPTSEIISTYTYQVGLVGSDFSYSTAIGLFNSVVNLVLLVAVNAISRRFGETSLW